MRQNGRWISLLALIVLTFAAPGLAADEAMPGAVSWPAPAYEQAGTEAYEAPPALDDASTLRDYLVYAALGNPGLEAAFLRWKAGLDRVAQAESLPDPELSYGYFIREVETRVGPQEQRVGLSQMVPWFGTLRLRGEAAGRAADAAYAQYRAAKAGLFYEVKKAYYEYYYLHRAIRITEENIHLLDRLEGVARSRFSTGASQSGVIKLQVELGKLTDRLQTLLDLRAPTAARLNAALNRPVEAPLPWPEDPPLSGGALDEDALLAALRETSPELQALRSRIDGAETEVALARKAYYPDVMVGVDYTDTGEALMSGTPDSGKDPIMARIAIDLPIWRGKYDAGVRESRRMQRAAEQALGDRANRLEADLKMALYRYRDADRRVALYGETLIAQADQSLRVTEEGYRAGSEDFLNLIDAERVLLEFQLSHERALADREIALAEIEKMVGRPIASDPGE